MTKCIDMGKITLGTCYYPEHWDKNLWRNDLERMLENGIEVIRVAEFSWSKFEPEEGRFTYEFYDEFLELVKACGMKVIFCTPTATPPAWLTKKYPEVLNADVNGLLYRHGSRRHYNYTSEIYHRLTGRIITKIANHYAGHQSIIGWQIDNEINCGTDLFYSKSDLEAFRIFLQEKYHALEQLNDAWGTSFWNQYYTAWNEIYLPGRNATDSANPHQVLDYYRFISDSACRFVRLQSDILRKYIKQGDFITTNGIFGNVDTHRMTEESLDFCTYDSYPNFAFCLSEDPLHSKDLNDRKWSRKLTEVRSISPRFGIMEQQSGANGWNTQMEAPAPKPGQMTLWTMQSIAHGADFVSYFRWKTCTFGTEMYWHGILDYSGRDNRRLEELAEIHRMTEKMKPIAGASYEASFAVLKDYDNVFDARLDRWHQRIDKVSEKGIFQAAQRTHTPFDYVYLQEDTEVDQLLKYPVLFYPHPVIMTEERANILLAYVSKGGTLIFGCRAGYKENNGHCVQTLLPGLVRNLSGTDVKEYTFVGPADGKVLAEWGGEKIEAAVFNDILQPLTSQAEVLAVYSSNYYAGEPALIKNQFGNGTVYYFGGAFTQDTTETFLRKLKIAEPYGEWLEIPEQCEIAIRKKDGKNYIFVLNYSESSIQINLKIKMYDLFVEQNAMGKQDLKAYQCKIYVSS